MAMLSLVTVIGIGLWFMIEHGLALLPLGMAGVILIVFYSTWVVRHPLVCLLAPGVGFGTLMVIGTGWVAAGEITATTFAASLVPFFLVSNLLLLNQFPDVEADATVGRKTLPIAIGRRNSSFVYLLFMMLGAVSLAGAIRLGVLPDACRWGLAGFALGLPVFVGALRCGRDGERLKPFMALNTILCLVTPLVVAGGLYFSP
jgi:1,4-dihydroxy-2-naphthoate octaprenyltransferase